MVQKVQYGSIWFKKFNMVQYGSIEFDLEQF